VPATGQVADLQVPGYIYSEKAIRAGVATATRGIVEAGDRTLGVVSPAITERGRTMIVR
jgi:hypothetical protein